MKQRATALLTALLLASSGARADAPSSTVPTAPDSATSSLYPTQVLELMREGRVEELARKVRYPLERPHPLSRLWQPADLVERYDRIFDEAWREKLIASEPSSWTEYGWRGRAYDGLWVDQDKDIIRAIARMSPAEEAHRLTLIEQIRAILNPSLQDFAEPLVYIETTKFKIWLDQTADGTRRYASWSRSKPLSADPDLLLLGGELEVMGSMNNETHSFHNGDTTYKVRPKGHPKHGWPTIEVRQGDQLLLDQRARWVDLATVVADPLPGPGTFSPTERDTLSRYVEVGVGSAPESLTALLRAHHLVLLDHEHTNSLEGNDPVPEGEHPGERSRFVIGSCSAVEAFWVFAASLRASWLPRPDAPELQWSAVPERDGVSGLEQVTLQSPNVEKWQTLWEETVTIVRRQGSGEILEYQHHSRGEGGGSTNTMKKLDGYTWVLDQWAFAD